MAVSYRYSVQLLTVNQCFSQSIHSVSPYLIFIFIVRFCADLCGAEGATQAIGFLLGLCSVPLTVGPPIAGMLYDQTKSYKLSFILAGIPALVGALLMTLIHRLKDDKVDIHDHEQISVPLAKPAWSEGMYCAYYVPIAWC